MTGLVAEGVGGRLLELGIGKLRVLLGLYILLFYSTEMWSKLERCIIFVCTDRSSGWQQPR